MKVAILLTATVGCYTATVPAPVATPPAKVVEPVTLFSGLFGHDRTQRYRVTLETSYWDDADPAADAKGNVNAKSTMEVMCAVDVTKASRWQTARVTCDEDPDATQRLPVVDALERLYVTDGASLWWTDETDDDHAIDAIMKQPPKLTVHPVERETHGDESEEGFGSTHAIVADGDGWCVTDDAWGGDEAGSSRCIGPQGVTRVSRYFAGGSTREETAVLE